jgi:hypothetical protein
MRTRTRRKSAVRIAATLVLFSLGATLAVVVTGSASASSPLPTTTSAATTTTSSTSTSTSTAPASIGLDPMAGRFSVINGTVNAASDHEILASSAFPNYTTGAVDNYYSMAHSHLDNSPFAEGTASPADTGPVGQTAAAGNFQQSQYADARWPGGPDQATYGSNGAPYADAAASDYLALANAAEPSNGLTGPALPVPKGFDSALQQALAQWKSKWPSVLGKPPSTTIPVTKTPTTPKTPTVTTPNAPVPTTAIPTVTTPLGGITAPQATVPSSGGTGLPRSMSSASTSKSSSSAKPKDGESLLTSSTQAALVPVTDGAKGIPEIDTTPTTTTQTETTETDPAKLKPYSLVMRGESSLGHVSIGGGQIEISGIHVKAAIANDGTSMTPPYEASVSVAEATIGGVPVTIDQDGVHVSGQKQGVPYKQISDSLNTALKQAGIQLFLVSPQVTTTSACGPSPTSTDSGSTSTTTTTTSTDQSNPASQCGTCPPSGTDTGTTSTSTTTTTASTSTDQSTPPPSSCDQSGASTSCGQTATTTSTNTTTTSALPTTTSASTTSTNQSTTTTSSTPIWCSPATTAGTCPTGTATTASTNPSTTTSTTPATPPATPEETVLATGVHVVFTQPVNQSGVPSQYVEHILGEVYVDSLATLAPPLPSLDLSSGGSCTGGSHSSKGGSKLSSSSSSTAGGGSSSGGSSALGSGSGSQSASGVAGSSQLASGSGSSSGGGSGGGGSFPASVVTALRKPLWLLLAYVLWQAIVIGTGASLWNWNWRKGGAS